MAGKADRLYAAGIRTDDDAVKPEEVKAPRRRGPQKQYELSSYEVGNFSEDYYNKEEPQALQTGPNTDCRADCGDGAATVANQAVEADPTCPHARAQHAKMRKNSKRGRSTIALMRKAERYRRAGELAECIEVLDEVLEIDPLSSAAWTKRGDCVARLGIDGTRDENDQLHENVDSRVRGGQPGSAAALYAVEHFERAQKLNQASLSSGAPFDRRSCSLTAHKYMNWNRLGHQLAGKVVANQCTNFPQVGRIKPPPGEPREAVESKKMWDIKND